MNLYSLDKCLTQNFDPVNTFRSKTILNNIDHSFGEDHVFATSGQVVQIWNYERSVPVQVFEWGADSMLKVKIYKLSKQIVLLKLEERRTIHTKRIVIN